MLTLFSYPGLYGLEDNNPYGLKVFAFMKLCRLPFAHEHILDAHSAPRAQLPYIVDGDRTIGDSDTIIAYLERTYALSIDDALTEEQRDLGLLVRRSLDDLYWVMSYSRWSDPRYWPTFRDALLETHPDIAPEQLEAARKYNFERYRYQGIGRFEPDEVYARGLADLHAMNALLGERGPFFGRTDGPLTSVDASLYGFVANIWFYDIDTPLKRFVSSHPNLVRHCLATRAALDAQH